MVDWKSGGNVGRYTCGVVDWYSGEMIGRYTGGVVDWYSGRMVVCVGGMIVYASRVVIDEDVALVSRITIPRCATR
ncbi:hypothetical protein P8452_56283 [Trifolium repens]|nr:hypothetical protein P8452_56283 [Trifolium repens]